MLPKIGGLKSLLKIMKILGLKLLTSSHLI
jgi:hypothetical protein